MTVAALASAPDVLRTRIWAAVASVNRHRQRLLTDIGRGEREWKADGSRLTATDRAISEGVLGDLAAAFPKDQGLSEELLVDNPVEVSSRYAWVLDPIDGTNNFAAGLAQCAISLALFEHGRPIYGIVYDAARRMMIHGGPGLGAWDGERPARVREGRLHRTSLVGFHSIHAADQYPGHGEAMIAHCKVRALGSSALHLAYVAVGLLDGVVDHNVKLWDIAAGLPILQAAGGEVRFLAHDPLPLERFDLNMPRILYVGGSTGMCDDLAAILTEAGRLPVASR
jgi:myo-inositol-1(or 4)-monophosphatase